jgi:hypothetical protein
MFKQIFRGWNESVGRAGLSIFLLIGNSVLHHRFLGVSALMLQYKA